MLRVGQDEKRKIIGVCIRKVKVELQSEILMQTQPYAHLQEDVLEVVCRTGRPKTGLEGIEIITNQ